MPPAPHREIHGFKCDLVWSHDGLFTEVLTEQPAILIWMQEAWPTQTILLSLEAARELHDGLGRAITVLERRSARQTVG